MTRLSSVKLSLMVIPFETVSKEALDNLLKEYCLRSWGLNDIEDPLDGRLLQARQALQRGDLVLWYSEYEESAYLLAANDLPQRSHTDSFDNERE